MSQLVKTWSRQNGMIEIPSHTDILGDKAQLNRTYLSIVVLNNESGTVA